MTGFCSIEGTVAGRRLRVEMKALNHRSLDLKTRLPREFAAHDLGVRGLVQGRFSRGAIDLKVERAAEEDAEPAAITADLALAKSYYDALEKVRTSLGIREALRLSDVVSFPNVLKMGSEELEAESTKVELEALVNLAVERLIEMRRHEGGVLAQVLLKTIEAMDATVVRLRKRRVECQGAYSAKVSERIQGVFDAHPLAIASQQALLESRVAQELALILDRTDIEEELARFEGHLAHFRKIMTEGGPVGRKLDFVIQELHREINTLGNKAQDLPISEDVVQTKVRLEQLREQVMNLE